MLELWHNGPIHDETKGGHGQEEGKRFGNGRWEQCVSSGMPELWVTMLCKLWVVYELGLSERGQHTRTVSAVIMKVSKALLSLVV